MTFGIESSNIVGYAAKEAPQGKFIILGAQFEQVAGGTKIDGLISGVSASVNWDEGYAFMKTAPQIQIPSGVGYTTRYFLNDGWEDDGSEEGLTKPGWCDEDGVIATDSYTPGVAIWLKDNVSTADVTVSGAVSDDDTVDIDCPATFALRANAFPIALTLNTDAMKVTGITGVEWDEGYAFMKTAPQIQIPSGVGYITRYYLSDGWEDDGSEEGVTKAGWCDEDGVIVYDVIPVAQGFWTKGATSSFKMTFTK